MINKINFCGNVYQSSSVQRISNPKEIAQIQQKADECGYDVFIYDQDKYYDGSSCYYGFTIKRDTVWNEVFDFKYPEHESMGGYYDVKSFEKLF